MSELYFEKLVADFAHISIFDIDDMDYFDWLFIRREAYIHELKQTEDGREYLENAWRVTQTEPDRKSLRKFGQKG